MKPTLTIKKEDFVKKGPCLYEIPASFRSNMRVPAHFFINEAILGAILLDRSIEQMINVTTLPGIVRAACAMPDIHEGYGFPIGGVAATDIDNGGVISPGGIGYDINCGVRLLIANMKASELGRHKEALADRLFHAVPSGVGQGGKQFLSGAELDQILAQGAPYLVKKGFGAQSDLEHCEEKGAMAGADPDKVSAQAKQRGLDQLGTLGSGNHFLEVQEVAQILDEKAANSFGLVKGGLTVMIHCGSRGLGHQVCTDYVRTMMPLLPTWGIALPDRELVCAPVSSKEGTSYYQAMQAAANFAWANRHTIAHAVREAFQKVFGADLYLSLLYDVSHNMGKRETHIVEGKKRELLVHRKGATRSFGPGNPLVTAAYRAVGQPVLIPGTMGSSSYVLAGTDSSMQLSFGSCCHGAGRVLSRIKAKSTIDGKELRRQLEKAGITIRCDSTAGLAEEAPAAYKEVESVVGIVHNAGLAKPVAQLKPLIVVKGG